MKKTIRIVAALLALSMVLSGCGGNSSSSGASGESGNASTPTGPVKDTMIVAQGADPKSLDPQGTTDSPAGRVASQIFDNLVEQDDKMNIVAGLAESWEIVDGTTYKFNLRKGVKFHNGEEFKASDVLYTFQRAAESPHAKSIMATIDAAACTAPDDYTFVMKLSKPFGPILAHLAHNVMAIVNEKAVKDAGDKVGQQPIGTGAFKFVEWKTGDMITLERNEDYYGDKASFKTLVFRTIPETASRSIEVETGGIDVAIDVLPSDIARLEASKDVKVNKTLDFTTNFVGLTTTQGPLKNVKVRQAINYAVDTKAIVDIVYQGTGSPAVGPMAPTIWSFTPDVTSYDVNIEKAKQLLTEAGYPEGFSITLTTNEQQQRIDTCEIVQNQLKAVGIDVKIQILEWGAYLEKVYAGTNEMFVLGWSAATGDPDYALYSQYYSANKGEAGNMTYYENAEVDKLLDIGRSSTDEAERKAAYEAAQKLIMEEVPCVYVQYGEKIAAYRSNVNGFNSSPSGTFDFSKMSFA